MYDLRVPSHFYFQHVPNSKELFPLIFTGLSSAGNKSHGSVKHFNWLVNSAEPRDIPPPSKANHRLFYSLVIFQVLCSALLSSHIMPAYNTAKFHSSENT